MVRISWLPVLAAPLAVLAILPWALIGSSHGWAWSLGIAILIGYPVIFSSQTLVLIFLTQKSVLKKRSIIARTLHLGIFCLFCIGMLVACWGQFAAPQL